MQSAKQEIISNLQKSIKDLTGLDIVPSLEHPTDEKHGDYSTNTAMAIFSRLQIKPKSKISKFKTPLELAQEIAKTFNFQLSTLNLERVDAVKPGFINFWLSKDYLTTLMIRIIRVGEEYGASELLKNKKIMVEFTDPNPFKEFHIGHLYSNIVGESICRLLESQGTIVKRANYQGDVGMHIAKSLYAILQISNLKSQISNLENKLAKERAEFLGKTYALGVKAYEEDQNAKKEIEKINRQIYEKDPSIMPLYKKGREWSLEYFETIYKRLGTKFDYYYFESEAAQIGLRLVKEYLKKGVFEESNGAVIFSGEKYGLHNRVFVNSQGLPTYEAKDLGLAQTKYKDFPYDQSMIITAQEQSSYFKVVIKALSLVNPQLSQKTKHIAHGVVRLPGGKMSSRSGNVITGEWLLDEAKNRIQKAYPEMDKDTAEKVTVGAVKYALLKSGIGRDIAFSFDESISFEGNSGPYLQYTYARTQSLLAKIKNQKSKIKNTIQNLKVGNHLELEEVSLLRALYRFSEVVEEATEKFAPNLLCNYLFDLAQKFNLFYQKHKIIGSENQDFRIALTSGVGQVIKNGLNLLGISAPEKM